MTQPTLHKTASGVYFAVLPKSMYKTLDITTLFTEKCNKEILFITSNIHKQKHWNGFKSELKEITQAVGEINYNESVLMIARCL